MLVVVDAVTSLFLHAPWPDRALGVHERSVKSRGIATYLVLVIVARTLPPVIIFSASIVTMNSSGWLACATAQQRVPLVNHRPQAILPATTRGKTAFPFRCRAPRVVRHGTVLPLHRPAALPHVLESSSRPQHRPVDSCEGRAARKGTLDRMRTSAGSGSSSSFTGMSAVLPQSANSFCASIRWRPSSSSTSRALACPCQHICRCQQLKS